MKSTIILLAVFLAFVAHVKSQTIVNYTIMNQYINDMLYDSGELLTGEDNMSHSLANLEDHHFKYPQFRTPGDVHIHFFGTMKLSFGNRSAFQDDDKIEIHFDSMGADLVNYVKRIPTDSDPVIVQKG